jgi:hypothetical protein
MQYVPSEYLLNASWVYTLPTWKVRVFWCNFNGGVNTNESMPRERLLGDLYSMHKWIAKS